MEGCPLGRDMIYEIIKRVDAATLAILARCAWSGDVVRCIADDNMWESLCEEYWPSTKNPKVKSLIKSIDGFKKFFTYSFPLDWKHSSYKDANKCIAGDNASEWVCIVDVLYKGKGIFSKVIEGLGTIVEDDHWFLDVSFQMDAITTRGEEILKDKVVLGDEDGEESSARFFNDVRISWILVNRVTKQIRNLLGWKAYMKWSEKDDINARFGCIFPSCAKLDSDADIMTTMTIKTNWSKIHNNKIVVEIKNLVLRMQRLGSSVYLNESEALVAFQELSKGPPPINYSPRYILQRLEGERTSNPYCYFAMIMLVLVVWLFFLVLFISIRCLLRQI